MITRQQYITFMFIILLSLLIFLISLFFAVEKAHAFTENFDSYKPGSWIENIYIDTDGDCKPIGVTSTLSYSPFNSFLLSKNQKMFTYLPHGIYNISYYYYTDSIWNNNSFIYVGSFPGIYNTSFESMYIDNFSVESVPECSTFTFLVLGIGILILTESIMYRTTK